MMCRCFRETDARYQNMSMALSTVTSTGAAVAKTAARHGVNTFVTDGNRNGKWEEIVQIHWSQAEHLQKLEELDAGLKRLDQPSPIWLWRHLRCRLGRHTFKGVYYPYCERCGMSKATFAGFLFISLVGWTAINFGFFIWNHLLISIASALFTLVLAWAARPLRFRFDRRS